MSEMEVGVIAEGGRIVVGIVQAIQTRRRKPIPPSLPLRLRHLQPIAQRHQFVQFGDNLTLLG